MIGSIKTLSAIKKTNNHLGNAYVVATERKDGMYVIREPGAVIRCVEMVAGRGSK